MSFSGAGSGTEADPYIITNEDELTDISQEPDAFYELGSNVNASGVNDPIIKDRFKNPDNRNMPFGPNRTRPDQPKEFKGTLDGKGNVIEFIGVQGGNGKDASSVSGADSFDDGGAGEAAYLFSAIAEGATVKNIEFKDHEVTGGAGGQGGFESSKGGDGGAAAGLAFFNFGTIKNVTVSGTGSAINGGQPGPPNDESRGGLPGPAAQFTIVNDGTIKGCDVTDGTVSAKDGSNGTSAGFQVTPGIVGGDAAGVTIEGAGEIIETSLDVNTSVTGGNGGNGTTGNSSGSRGGDAGDVAGVTLTATGPIIDCNFRGSVVAKDGGSGANGDAGDGGSGGNGGDGGTAAGIAINGADIKFCEFTGSVTAGQGGTGGQGQDFGSNGACGNSGDAAGMAISASDIENCLSDGNLSVSGGSNGGTPGGNQEGGPGGDGGDAGSVAGLALTCSTVRNSFARYNFSVSSNGGSGGGGSGGENSGGNGGNGGDGSDVVGLVAQGDVFDSYFRGSIDNGSSGGNGGNGGDGAVGVGNTEGAGGDGGDGGDGGSSAALTLDGNVTRSYVEGGVSVTASAGAGGATGANGSDGTGGSFSPVAGDGGAPSERFLLGSGTITNGFFDSSQDSGNGTGLTTSELKNESNLTGFDFTNDWQVDSTVNGGFANLRGVTPGGGQPPAPTAEFDTRDALPLAGNTVQFVDLSQAPNSRIVQYNWTFDDGTTSTLDEPTKDFSGAGRFTVTVQIENKEGNVDSNTKEILINEEAGPGVLVTGAGIVNQG